MTVDLALVARMRLVSQGVVEPRETVGDVVRHLTCVQGQDFPGSSTSIALRTRRRSRAQVREAYDSGAIVRSWPMRGTLFVVAAEDLGWIGGLTAEKMLQASARRREELGLTSTLLDRAADVARRALSGDGLIRADLLACWQDAGLDTAGGRGYHLLAHMALDGEICQGPTQGKEQRFVLTREWIPHPRRLDRDEGIRELVSRYITSRGPVPTDDVCWWSKLGKTEMRPHVAALAAAGTITALDVNGREFWMSPDLPDRYADLRRATARPLLLPGFDEIVLGYGDRSAVLTPAEEALVVPGRNGVFKGTVLHHGHAVGTWARPPRAGATVSVAPFGELPTPVAATLPRLTSALPT